MYRIMTNEIKARSQDDERQAELIKSLTEQIAELQGQIADLETAIQEQQEVGWLLDELESAANGRQVMIERREGDIWLSVCGKLHVGQTLREAAMQAFEK